MEIGSTTLIEALRQAAVTDKACIFLDQKEPVMLTYRELLTQAMLVAGKLQHEGICEGDSVVVVLPTGRFFAITFWGIVFAGGVPCVLPSPTLSRAPQRGLAKIERVSQKIGSRLLITTQRESAVWGGDLTGLPLMTVERLESLDTHPWREVVRQPADLAVIQATSGSTSAPKCVMLSQRNIQANCCQLAHRFETSWDDVVVCWLPMFHDMGLIGCFLYSIFCQIQLVLLPPSKFVRRPVRWLNAIHDYRGTQSPAPNFAYGYLMTRVKDAQIATLDLSSWRLAICGAEPIDPLLLDAFLGRYREAGLRPAAIAPAYGMAEVSLCATVYGPRETLSYETVCESSLHEQELAIPLFSDEELGTIIVCNCGRPVSGMQIDIRSEDQTSLAEREVGRIWLKGPSVMQGYMGDAAKTAEVLVEGWLDSGDIGYLRDGCLFVLGREKELIIIRGQNYYPTDFERVAEQVAGIETGRVAAFGVYHATVFSEELQIVCEVKKSQIESDLAEQVKAHVASQTGVPPAVVNLVPRGTIPRTTSGKLQRNALKQLYQTAQNEKQRVA